VVLAAVKQDADAIQYASDELKNDGEIKTAASKYEWSAHRIEFKNYFQTRSNF